MCVHFLGIKQSTMEVAQVTKQFKWSEPDLTVILGKDGKDTFRHYSLLLAIQSEYIDRLLGSSMKESETKVISFPDIEAGDWTTLIGFLNIFSEDGTKVPKMTVEEAIYFAPIYHKYSFHAGLALCSAVLEDTFQIDNYLDDDWLYIKDLQIEMFKLAAMHGMDSLYSICLDTFESRLTRTDPGTFSFEQLRQLAPLVAKEQILLNRVSATREEVLCSSWPRVFHMKCFLRERLDDETLEDYDDSVRDADR